MEIVLASKKQRFAVELLTNSADSEASRGKLAHLRRLRHLDLSGTSVSSLTLSHGLDCADLRTLAVSDCRGGLVSDQGSCLCSGSCRWPQLQSRMVSAGWQVKRLQLKAVSPPGRIAWCSTR